MYAIRSYYGKRRLVDDPPARDVHQDRLLFHPPQMIPADHPPRIGGERDGDHDEIAGGEQGVESDVPGPEGVLPRLRETFAVSYNFV